jgi:hypothetical protein
VKNKHNQSSLHCICSQSDRPDIRFDILCLMIDWKGIDSRNSLISTNKEKMSNNNNDKKEYNNVDIIEKVSINHVDKDGNAALHYAAENGLFECVVKLVECGAILSIVNKDQLTW